MEENEPLRLCLRGMAFSSLHMTLCLARMKSVTSLFVFFMLNILIETCMCFCIYMYKICS